MGSEMCIRDRSFCVRIVVSEPFSVRIVLCQNHFVSESFCVRIVVSESFCVRIVLCQNRFVSESFCVRIVLCQNVKICTNYCCTLYNLNS